MAELLESEGFEAVQVANGLEAILKLRQPVRRPDAIVLDLRMPVMDGWTFLELRDSDPVMLITPVVVVSAEVRKRANHRGVTFLPKPVDVNALLTILRHALNAVSDPQKVSGRSEPWSVDTDRPTIVRNKFGSIAAVAFSELEARRIVAAINSTSRISTAALERGIIDKGLKCLSNLNRYDRDDSYRRELDSGPGFKSLVAERDEVALLLNATEIAREEGTLPREEGRLPRWPSS